MTLQPEVRTTPSLVALSLLKLDILFIDLPHDKWSGNFRVWSRLGKSPLCLVWRP